jgi:poly(3-hydroxyalkanoate) depolymerase
LAERRITRGFRSVGGERIWVVDSVPRRAKVAARTPLLLLNGIGASTSLLEPLLERPELPRVIAFDLPGVGASTPPSRMRRMRHYATLVADLLDALDVLRAHVLGVSWGGALAQQVAFQYPEQCARLVLAATSPGQWMVPPSPRVMLRMSTPRRYTDERFFERVAGSIYGGDLRRDARAVAAVAERMVAPTLRGYANQLYALAGWSTLLWLHRLRQPTLVMAGADDPLVPLLNARILAHRIPDARLEVYDCGHLFLLTRIESVARSLARFLEGGG